MKRFFPVFCVVLLLSLGCLPANAATVTGEVRDLATNLGLNGSVKAYWQDPVTTQWEMAGYAAVSESDPTFTFSSLQAGDYYFSFEAPNYISEFYNNVTIYDSRKIITLGQSQTRSLGTAYLKPLPIRFSSCQIFDNQVPPGGGTITVECILMNDTATDRTIAVWARVAPFRTVYNSTFVSDSYSTPLQKVFIGANSTIPVLISFDVPANAPSGGSIADVFVNCGFNRWVPLTREAYVGNITK